MSIDSSTHVVHTHRQTHAHINPCIHTDAYKQCSLALHPMSLPPPQPVCRWSEPGVRSLRLQEKAIPHCHHQNGTKQQGVSAAQSCTRTIVCHPKNDGPEKGGLEWTDVHLGAPCSHPSSSSLKMCSNPCLSPPVLPQLPFCCLAHLIPPPPHTWVSEKPFHFTGLAHPCLTQNTSLGLGRRI